MLVYLYKLLTNIMGIQQTANQIDKQMELIKYANILPPKEAYMLLTNQKYQTGSDYLEIDLQKEVVKECRGCDGKGFYPIGTSEDDFDYEECFACDGHGKYFIEAIF